MLRRAVSTSSFSLENLKALLHSLPDGHPQRGFPFLRQENWGQEKYLAVSVGGVPPGQPFFFFFFVVMVTAVDLPWQVMCMHQKSQIPWKKGAWP